MGLFPQKDIAAARLLKKAGARLDVVSDAGATPLDLLEHMEAPAALKVKSRKGC